MFDCRYDTGQMRGMRTLADGLVREVVAALRACECLRVSEGLETSPFRATVLLLAGLDVGRRLPAAIVAVGEWEAGTGVLHARCREVHVWAQQRMRIERSAEVVVAGDVPAPERQMRCALLTGKPQVLAPFASPGPDLAGERPSTVCVTVVAEKESRRAWHGSP